MRILGVGASERFACVRDIPTMAEQGIPMNVIVVGCTRPAGTPKYIVDQINKWFVEIERTDETPPISQQSGR